MRLILSQVHITCEQPPELPGDTHVFQSWDDFSVGPLGAWGDWDRFFQERAAFHDQVWEAGASGVVLEYMQWIRSLPHLDLVALYKSGVDVSDIQWPLEFDEAVAQATNVELWYDDTVQGHVFLWFVAAAYTQMGINRDAISVCRHINWRDFKESVGFWNDMLLDAATRKFKTRRPTATEWDQWAACWDAVAGPATTNFDVLGSVDEGARQTIDVIRGRVPNPETGLSNIQLSLLQFAPETWGGMSRVIVNAMKENWDHADQLDHNVLKLELEKMAGMDDPFVQIEGEGRMTQCRICLTSRGKAMKDRLFNPQT